MLEQLTRQLWGAPTIGLFLFTGLYFSIRTGFYQFFGVKQWLEDTAGSLIHRKQRQDGLSPGQTLSTALAATIGTGSIAGVATGLTFGGAGAIFWMWLSALLAMMTGWAEKTLSVAVREKRGQSWVGGPMLWLKQKHYPHLANAFAFFVLFASFGMGDMVQSNSMAQALQSAWGVPPMITGLFAAALTGLAFRGGLKRLGKVCERLVPMMAVLYLAGGIWVILAHLPALAQAIRAILHGALSREAILGGGAASALQYGLARGVVTNEAGLGSSAMVHCASANRDPAKEGSWGIFEVFFSTLVVCSTTALAILTSGADLQNAAGAQLTSDAFCSVMGQWGGGFIAVCLSLFGFSSLLGWSWYGRCGLQWLTGGGGTGAYEIIFLLLTVLGSRMELSTVWQLSDCCNALMAWPSLIALWLWRREILDFRQRV